MEPDGVKRARRATMREVAKLASVSLGTVSRVINDNKSVSANARQRVLAAMEQLEYVPDAVAQSMRSHFTMAVGCMVSDLSNPLFASAVSMAEQALQAAGYIMILTNSQDSSEREREILSLFRRRRVDGILCTISCERDQGILSMLRDNGIPVVLIERTATVPVDTVSTDHFSGMFQATSYLLSLGHRRIGLITVTQEATPGRERMAGFVKAHSEAGIAIDPQLTAFYGFSAEYGYRTGYEFLTRKDPPTAILAGGNQMRGVLRAVRALNLEIPRDLSLVSVGDTDLAELHTPPLTVVRWDTMHVGRTAAEILLSRINGTARSGPVRLLLPSELIVRGSCAPPTKS